MFTPALGRNAPTTECQRCTPRGQIDHFTSLLEQTPTFRPDPSSVGQAAMAEPPADLESTLKLLFSAAPPPIPCASRAAVALILRHQHSHPPPGPCPPHPIPLDLLFIQRAVRRSDPWSAHIAFPGGRRDAADTSDLATAVRETAEEVCLDLSDAARYRLVGQLPDRHIGRSGRKAVLSAFIFLQLPAAARQRPQPEPAEVAAVFWAPLSVLHGTTPATHELRPVHGVLASVLRLDRLQMPAVDVLAHARELVAAPAAELPHVLLWGITLRCVGDLVDSLGGRRVDWPSALPGLPWLARLVVGVVDMLWWIRSRMTRRSLVQRRIAL